MASRHSVLSILLDEFRDSGCGKPLMSHSITGQLASDSFGSQVGDSGVHGPALGRRAGQAGPK
jgi:hypothetical protein